MLDLTFLKSAFDNNSILYFNNSNYTINVQVSDIINADNDVGDDDVDDDNIIT